MQKHNKQRVNIQEGIRQCHRQKSSNSNLLQETIKIKKQCQQLQRKVQALACLLILSHNFKMVLPQLQI
jgi:hypothetical protein